MPEAALTAAPLVFNERLRIPPQLLARVTTEDFARADWLPVAMPFPNTRCNSSLPRP